MREAEDGEVIAGVEVRLSNPDSRGLAAAPDSPLTRLSKSVSDVPFALSDAPETGPKDMMSSFAGEPGLPTASSWSFLVCSSSTLLERCLMSSMKAWNCLRFRSGPRLMLHKMGRISMATNSASATCPTTRRTRRAAIITAGSLVFIALIKGTIFSCMVYLSRALGEGVFFCGPSPSSPSSLPGSLEPPQSVTKA